MGEAKRKSKSIETTKQEAREAALRFESVKSFPIFEPHRNKQVHAVSGYHHLMSLIFLRAKHIHKCLLRELSEKNSYTSFILLKAYWETVTMLGYCYIRGTRLIEAQDYSELTNWVIKHALGGKHFVTKEMAASKGLDLDAFTQTNLLTQMKTVDEYFNKTYGKGEKFSKVLELYNEQIAEAGHATFIGLEIAEDELSNGSRKPNPNKTSSFHDDAMIYNNLSISNLYFFKYWQLFTDGVEIQLANAEKLTDRHKS